MTRLPWLAALSMLLSCPSAWTEQRAYPHHEVQAALLRSFIRFVDWPAGRLSGKHAPIVIGLIGETPLRFPPSASAEAIRGHPVVIRRFRQLRDLAECHVLFIALSREDEVRQALVRLRGTATLTVSEQPSFVRLGGMIGMITRETVQLEVNLQAVEEEGLIISSKLLRLATVVRPPPQGAGEGR